jgi:cytochrome c oxidase assembly protein subunit 15
MQETWLHRYSQLTVAAAFFVIFAGAMVTSTGSGMAVPDWPTSFGTWMPKMEGGVFYEHGHRMVAGATALLTTILALWVQFAEPRAMVRRLAWYAFFGILTQALLGGITVMLGTSNGWDHTSPIVSTLHACLAQALFATLVSVAITTAPGWKSMKVFRPETTDRRRWAVVLVALVYVQIILGAVMRHQNAGLIISDFPLSYGRLIPEFYEWRVGINYAHRVGALMVLILALSLSISVLRHSQEPWLKTPAAILLGAVLLQVSLGACVVWSGLQPIITSAHVIGGALVLTSSLALTLRLFKVQGLSGA